VFKFEYQPTNQCPNIRYNSPTKWCKHTSKIRKNLAKKSKGNYLYYYYNYNTIYNFINSSYIFNNSINNINIIQYTSRIYPYYPCVLDVDVMQNILQYSTFVSLNDFKSIFIVTIISSFIIHYQHKFINDVLGSLFSRIILSIDPLLIVEGWCLYWFCKNLDTLGGYVYQYYPHMHISYDI
jgi:hypothetical protein